MVWILLPLIAEYLCYPGGYRESKPISGDMFNLSHHHIYFYSAGLCRSRRNFCQRPAIKFLGQAGPGFNGTDLPAAGILYLHSRYRIG